MLSSTLDTVRRLLGATCRGIPFAEARPAAAKPAGGDLIYRLKSWPKLPEAGRNLEIYRLLSVMSSRPVTRQWIKERCRMDAHQLESLLQRFIRDGALEIIDPARFAGREPCRA